MRATLAILSLVTSIFTLNAQAETVLWGVPHHDASALSGLLVGPHSLSADVTLLRPFTTDGCSSSPNGLPGHKDLWLDCCIQHDTHYWIGGTADQKQQADNELRQCISDKGHSDLAEIYYEGVRMGGGPLSNKTYRWGYGWNKVRDYAPITAQEMQQAEALYGKDLIDLKTGVEKMEFPIVVPKSSKDPGLQKMSAEEITIYNYLKKNLRTDDVITSAELLHSERSLKFYSVILKSCEKSTLHFVVEKEDLTVKDPGHCLGR